MSDERARNCPFYGCAMFPALTNPSDRPFVLYSNSGSNQRGLLAGRHAPCVLETSGQTVEWAECPYLNEIRI
jgi:hypothetical protein